MYIERKFDVLAALGRKSIFLLGPRQTGKTFLIRHVLRNYRFYNLLESETFLKLSRAPQRIRDGIAPNPMLSFKDYCKPAYAKRAIS